MENSNLEQQVLRLQKQRDEDALQLQELAKAQLKSDSNYKRLEGEVARLDSRIDDIQKEHRERVAGMLDDLWSLANEYLQTRLASEAIMNLRHALLQRSDGLRKALDY